MHATLATGGANGGYALFAEKLKEELAHQGFTLELVPSGGSLDNLGKLQRGEVQMALVQSGQELTLPARERERLHGLGVMYQEPLWLFKRKDVDIDAMGDLLQLRVAIGTPNSGTAPSPRRCCRPTGSSRRATRRPGRHSAAPAPPTR